MDLHCIILFVVCPVLTAISTAPLYWTRLKLWLEREL
jgi:hypothetical protein